MSYPVPAHSGLSTDQEGSNGEDHHPLEWPAASAAEPSQHDRSISQRVISQRQTARFTCGTGRGQGGQMHDRKQSELVFACGENTHSVGVGRPAALQARADRKHARRRSRRMNCAPRSAAIGCGATTKNEGTTLTLTLDQRTARPPWQRRAHTGRRRTPAPHQQGLTPRCARCRHRRAHATRCARCDRGGSAAWSPTNCPPPIATASVSSSRGWRKQSHF